MRGLLAILGLAVVGGAVALWLAVRAPARSITVRDAAPVTPDALTTRDASAVVAAPVDAASASAEVLASLRASGSASEVWAAQGMALLESVAREASASSDLGCFVAGCGGMFTFASQQDYEQRRTAIESSSAAVAWTGGKRWTDVERRPDGRVTVALLLYRPD